MKAEGEPGSVPMIRPPRLHLGREGTASRLELFFDLAYVLVIMQLAIAFVDDLSWLGLARSPGCSWRSGSPGWASRCTPTASTPTT